MKTVVKKYGGATLSTPQKILDVAASISQCHQNGEKIVVVVSAMGKTTNELIQLATQVSPRPKRREMDMLLTTGERISMALLSMALNDLQCPAISFTGSQAGVLTDDSHLNAFITNVLPYRIQENLEKNQVVIVAGFQGVSPQTKEITTLGRGGSDTTAVALTAALHAERCEILKDVSGVCSADPKICPTAHSIHHLTYQQMLEMTFWGAKVLHYRSVELALKRNVSIYVGPAHSIHDGTWISETPNFIKEGQRPMYESVQIISINTQSDVVMIDLKLTPLAEGLSKLQQEFQNREIPFPQLLATEVDRYNHALLFLCGPTEIITLIRKEIHHYSVEKQPFSTVTATCSGASTPEIAQFIIQKLSQVKISPLRVWMSGMSCSVLLKTEDTPFAISALHELVGAPLQRR